MSALDTFADSLSSITDLKNVENLYRRDDPASAVRLHNLKVYLQLMKELKPTRILVGEAPGYKGCKLTGIPFTSERILLNGMNNVSIFGKDKGYQKIDELSLASEASATMMWGHLSTYSKIPLLWNAFPFHPYKPGKPSSNREPTSDELRLGSGILRELITLFAIKQVIAVGNNADKTLNAMGIQHEKVRHPANGGKADFVDGISKLMQE